MQCDSCFEFSWSSRCCKLCNLILLYERRLQGRKKKAARSFLSFPFGIIYYLWIEPIGGELEGRTSESVSQSISHTRETICCELLSDEQDEEESQIDRLGSSGRVNFFDSHRQQTQPPPSTSTFTSIRELTINFNYSTFFFVFRFRAESKSTFWDNWRKDFLKRIDAMEQKNFGTSSIRRSRVGH